eukprot:3670362-Pleurochrysis_carterae.AAC.1
MSICLHTADVSDPHQQWLICAPLCRPAALSAASAARHHRTEIARSMRRRHRIAGKLLQQATGTMVHASQRSSDQASKEPARCYLARCHLVSCVLGLINMTGISHGALDGLAKPPEDNP